MSAERNPAEALDDPEDMSDFLQELRVLQQGTQIFTAFLATVPFSAGFAKLEYSEHWLYALTFFFAISSLIMFSAPPAQHRFKRPVRDKETFKDRSSKVVDAGIVSMGLSIILGTNLVMRVALPDDKWAWIFSIGATVLIVALWLIVPLRRK